MANIGEFVTKQTFARVFKLAWQKSCRVEVAVNRFAEAGIFPPKSRKGHRFNQAGA